jgi:hypothetical protein
MSTYRPERPDAAAASTVEWRPGRAAAVLLNVLAVPLLLAGLAGFLWLAAPHLASSGRLVFGMLDLLRLLLLTVALTVLLFVAHEGLHGLMMAAFGARPRFGALMIGGVAPALYTTAPGHSFSRAQYLAVAVTPAIVLSGLGALTCLTAVGPLLVVPLSIHLSGCVGDLAATFRLLREPPKTRCEDLRDGIRFHRPAAGPY